MRVLPYWALVALINGQPRGRQANLILSHLRRGADVARYEGGAEGTTAVSIGLLAQSGMLRKAE